MKKVTIKLTDQVAEFYQSLAQASGTAVEQLLEASLEKFIEVLEKYAK